MLVFEKKVPRPNVDEINGVPSYMTPHACTQDPRFFSHKLLSKSFEIKRQLMMAAATGLPSVGYKTWCACRQSVCSTIREVTNPLITKNPTDYRPSVSGPTYLEHFFRKHSIYLNPTKTVGDLVYIPRQNICNHYVYGSTNSWPIPFEREPAT